MSVKGSADAAKKDAPKKKRHASSKAAAKGKAANPDEAGSPGDAAGAAADIDALAPGRIRPLDFSQPTKFTTEIRRRITGAIEQFCEAASGRLSAELAVDVQLSIAEVDQHTWAASKARLPADIAIRIGEIVGLDFKPQKLSVFEAASGRAIRTALHEVPRHG